MAATTYQSLIDGGVFYVPDVPEMLAIKMLRKATIELCRRTKLWVVSLDAQNLVANEAAYDLEPNSGTVVERIENVWVSGIPLDPTTRFDLERKSVIWPTITGTPTHYYQENSEEIYLWPTPSSSVSSALTMKVALIPSRVSTGVEKWIMERYQDAIVCGAIAELLGMHGQQWTDLQSAQYYKAEFENHVQSAMLFTQKGLGKAPLRTTPQYF